MQRGPSCNEYSTAASAHWNTIQYLTSDASTRELQGYTGETGVEYNQTDFSTV